MGMPNDVPIIDTMIGFPSTDRREVYRFMADDLRDAESGTFKMPAQYMFKDLPEEIDEGVDPVGVTLYTMDRFGVERGMVNVGNETREDPRRAVREHPDRFLAALEVDPRRGMDEIRRIRAFHEEYGLVALSTFPSGYRTAINEAPYYPIYATAVELGLPIFITVGVPGPRLPLAPQKVEYLDEICWFFPELTVVMRHGAEPWEDLAVKLMLKWPNLHYSTSAFAPKHYPRAIVDYANTRGADKIIYAGYFPAGLTYDRIVRELPDVGFRDEVWPKFLRGNAARVLGLD
ncbi:MAG: amidohydrolase family protein [Acidobacteria bacterium]|nr:amidohydrolase family protein [Acidobacteriota bacterium]